METTAKVLVLMRDGATAGLVAQAGFNVRDTRGQWLDLGDQEESVAADLSRTLQTMAVFWLIHMPTDLIWLKGFAGGLQVRELEYSSEEGWIVTGDPMPFEATEPLAAWLGRRYVSAAGDGRAVLDSFLGGTHSTSRRAGPQRR